MGKVITQELIRKYCTYHKEGYLTWKERWPYLKAKVGDIVGNVDSSGYSRLKFFGNRASLHRLIFCYHRGYFPSKVDHKDRDKLNNKIENLRDVTHAGNAQNRSSCKGSSSQYLGVSKRKTSWEANIYPSTGGIYIGNYKKEEVAAAAYNVYAMKHYGEYANLNDVPSITQEETETLRTRGLKKGK